MTLVELVITLSVIIVITSVCFFRGDTNKYEVDLFTKQLCSDIRYVRKSNMLGDFNTYIYYKNENDKISYILRSDGKDKKKVYLPQNTKISYGKNTIKFKSDGAPNPIGQTIIVYNKKVKKEITIVPISGRVLLKEGKYEA